MQILPHFNNKNKNEFATRSPSQKDTKKCLFYTQDLANVSKSAIKDTPSCGLQA